MARRGHAFLAIQSAATPDTSPGAGREDFATSPVPQTSAAIPNDRPRQQLSEDTARYRERLLTQQYRARELFGSSWLRVPGVAPLILVADQALGLVKRLQAAIERRGNLGNVTDVAPIDSLTDNATLDSWLAATDAALGAIEQQYAYFELTCRYAESVRELSQRLLGTERVCYGDLLPLANQVVESVAEVKTCDELFPLPGVQMGSVFQGVHPNDAPAVYTQGVQSARFAAWSLSKRPGWHHDLPDVVFAALLQDIGWLALRPYLPDATRRGPRRVQWLSQQHPQVGAAILGGVFRAPLILPQMIALHHERLNGTGYPRRVGLSAISRSGRMLGCISRLYELYSEMALDARQGDAASHLTRVAQGLQQEAVRGWWDLELANELLVPITRIDTKPVPHTSDELPASDATAGQPNRELHGEHPELPGSHAPQPNRGYADFGVRPAAHARRG